MGIGSTAAVALEQGRSAIGFELKESYHQQALRNVGRYLQSAQGQTSLLSLMMESAPEYCAAAEEQG